MVDIIIPTIDDPKYLDRALQSIKDTCQIDQIAVYIINDASNYDSELYEKIIEKYPEIQIGYKVLPTSIGPGPARNEGIKMGSGDWICFLDCDDTYIDDVVKYCDNNYDFFISEIENPLNFFTTVSCDALIAGIHGMGIQRKYLETYNLYFPNVKFGSEDTIFRFCAHLFSNKKKSYKNKSYYQYMIRPDSNFMHRKSRDNSLNNEELQHYRGVIGWFAVFSEHLNTLFIPKNIIHTSQWNQTFLKGSLTMVNFNYNIKDPTNFYPLFLIFTYLCKKYLDFTTFKLQLTYNDQNILLLLFIRDFFTLTEDNILIFQVVSKKESYLYFLKRFESFLPGFITHYYYQILDEYYDIDHFIKLWVKYYYQDFFVY